MPLIYSGQCAGDPYSFDTNYEAHYGMTRVVVVVSKEVIDDYGLSAAHAKGSEKYDRGKREGPNRVSVRTTDFR